MNTRTLIAFVALALCVQYSQASRQLLAPTTCGALSQAPDCGTLFKINNATTVENTTDAAGLKADCCIAIAAKNCSDITDVCPADHVLLASGGTVAANKTWGDAETQCCEAKFTTETCLNVTTKTCPTGQYFDDAPSVANIVKSNTTAITATCCKPIPACSATTCEAPYAVGNATLVPTSNVPALRVAQCCVLPENATCSNWAAKTNASEAVEFNCTKIASFPAKDNNAAISISKLTEAAATAKCCDAVYLAGATCASIEFNCTTVAGFEADASIPSNTSLANVFKVNALVAKKCCAEVEIPAVEDNSTTNATTKKNSAGAKAVSFGVSALALLAMLLL